MRALKQVITAIILFLLMWLVVQNWTNADLAIKPGLVLTGPLGLWLLLAFAAGIGPYMLWHKAHRWIWQRKLNKANAKIDGNQPPTDVKPIDPEAELLARARVAGGFSTYGNDVPSQARPTAVPPAGA